MKISLSQSGCGYDRERIYQKKDHSAFENHSADSKVAVHQHTNRKLSAEKGKVSSVVHGYTKYLTSFTGEIGHLYSTFRASGYSMWTPEKRCIRVPPSPHNKQRVEGRQTSFQYDDIKVLHTHAYRHSSLDHRTVMSQRVC